MATDHFEDDIDIEPDLDEGDDLDLNVLDDDEEDVEFDAADVEYVDGEAQDEEDEGEEEDDGDVAEVEGDAATVEHEEEEEDDDVVDDDDDDDEEEDEETLEVLLGPDSETTVTPARSRKDDSGDAPPGEGEFTCRSCFLVKRRAQLADADAMICLDCA